MGKFKVSLEFKLNVEGEREDVPEIMANLQRQIGSALGPSAQIAGGGRIIDARPTEAQLSPKEGTPKKSRRRRVSGRDTADVDKPPLLNWLHDVETWGFPLQTWNNRDKAIWLLHVAAGSINLKEMTPPEIANVFNKLFKSAGQIRPSNIARDLNIARNVNPPLLSIDLKTDKVFLTISGEAAARQLCIDAKGPTTAATS